MNFGEQDSYRRGSFYREEQRDGVIMFLAEYDIDYNNDGEPAIPDTRPNVGAGRHL